MDRESRIWRRLAIAGAATIVLLTARVAIGRPLLGPNPVRDLRRLLAEQDGEPGEPVGEDELFAETWEQEIERRLGAVESNAAELGELRNVINLHESDLRNLGAERGM